MLNQKIVLAIKIAGGEDYAKHIRAVSLTKYYTSYIKVVYNDHKQIILIYINYIGHREALIVLE